MEILINDVKRNEDEKNKEREKDREAEMKKYQ
jgi:hypothetical protein